MKQKTIDVLRQALNKQNAAMCGSSLNDALVAEGRVHAAACAVVDEYDADAAREQPPVEPGTVADAIECVNALDQWQQTTLGRTVCSGHDNIVRCVFMAGWQGACEQHCTGPKREQPPITDVEMGGRD